MHVSTIWPSVLERLEKEVSKQQFTTWIQPLNAAGETPDRLRLIAPNRFVMQWVRDRFAARIAALMSELSGVPVTVVVDLATQIASPAAHLGVVNGPADGPIDGPGANLHHAPSVGGPTGSDAGNAAAEPRDSMRLTPRPVLNGHDERSGLDSTTHSSSSVATNRRPGHAGRGNLAATYTFENFVSGKANQLARAAAVQVAEHPGSSYNPLFIYGGVGLGKTHLIQAVGNLVQLNNPRARIRYLHAAQYVSDVIRAYRDKSFDEFKRDYHSLDLLLIDDIQFFNGKDRTQEEFFYAFNALLEAQKQVIVTSDTYPKDMAGIDERLKSRFSWGLTVAIQAPEQEMRVAITLRKAQENGMVIPEDVAFLIAQNARSNVRELEGALRSVLAFARFNNKAITIETAREALKDVIALGNRQITVESIQKTVADFYKMKIADMHSKKRSRNIARPRQVAMALTKDLTSMSYPDIGEAYGNRDHTTVLHACRTITTLRSQDQQLNRDYLVLEQILKS